MFYVTGLSNLWLRRLYLKPTTQYLAVKPEAAWELTLEGVWEVLENGQWESKTELGAASGVDDNALNSMINFLDRWNFIEVRREPELQVRRRPSALSPLEVIQILHSIANQPTATPRIGQTIAERVACCSCGGRQLELTGGNEVKCTKCHEKQWYKLEHRNTPLNASQHNELPTKSGRLQRMLVRLDRPRNASRKPPP